MDRRNPVPTRPPNSRIGLGSKPVFPQESGRFVMELIIVAVVLVVVVIGYNSLVKLRETADAA